MEATNIGFMLKYMFRENLQIAKAKFTEAVTNYDNFKKMPQAAQAQELLTRLVSDTLDSYGDTGIYDPERLADIDFLTQPEALVALVREGRTAQKVCAHTLSPGLPLTRLASVGLGNGVHVAAMPRLCPSPSPPLAPLPSSVFLSPPLFPSNRNF